MGSMGMNSLFEGKRRVIYFGKLSSMRGSVRCGSINCSLLSWRGLVGVSYRRLSRMGW